MMEFVLGHYNYWIVVVLMMAGFYTLISRGNLIKKIAGLNIFQVSVFLLYISIGNVQDGTTPIIAPGFDGRARFARVRIVGLFHQ